MVYHHYRRPALCEPKGGWGARSLEVHETWVPLLEKSFAKLYGTYEHLISGFADAAMRDLTAAPQRSALPSAAVLGGGGRRPHASAGAPWGRPPRQQRRPAPAAITRIGQILCVRVRGVQLQQLGRPSING